MLSTMCRAVAVAVIRDLRGALCLWGGGVEQWPVACRAACRASPACDCRTRLGRTERTFVFSFERAHTGGAVIVIT
jgi:hypothetical protein